MKLWNTFAIRKGFVARFSNGSYTITCFKVCLGNNLICPKHPGFRLGDFCINQLLSITPYIFTSFDYELEVRGIFQHISKAFHKVWQHNGLICKSKQNEIKDKLLCLLTDFLKNCKQRVVLNGQFSSWIKPSKHINVDSTSKQRQSSTLSWRWYLVENENWAEVHLSTLFLRWQNNVETTSIEIHRFNVDKSTLFQRWNFRWKWKLSWRMFIDIVWT